MDALVKPAFASVAAVLLLSLAPAALFAKNVSVGIYAVIDQVTFEPDGASPNLVRISGVFVVPIPLSSGDYRTPQRGYLYFRIRPGMEQASRKDWNQLKVLLEQARWSDLPSIGCRIRAILLAIRTIHW